MELCGKLYDDLLSQTKVAIEKGSDSLWVAVQVSSYLSSYGVTLPSVELASRLVSYVCWENNVSSSWKFLEKAMALKIVPPLLVLGLLSKRVIPHRHSCPAAFRLYMELLKRHVFCLKENMSLPNHQNTMKSIDEVLHLSQILGAEQNEDWVLLVLFIFTITWQLVDAAVDDEGLFLTNEPIHKWSVRNQEMEVDDNMYREEMESYRYRMQRHNTSMAIELIGQIAENKVTSRILFLARENMGIHWQSFVHRVELLVENSSALRKAKSGSVDMFMKLISSPEKMEPSFYPAISRSSPLINSAGLCVGVNQSALWIPLDMLLEDAIDGSQVNAMSAVEIIKSMVKSLRAINDSSWHETFLVLWVAALRLVQRERDHIEGPVPCLETRLSLLLSIIPLVVADIVEEAESCSQDKHGTERNNEHRHERNEQVSEKHRAALICSLQKLQDYQSLLTPPMPIKSDANQAAVKAMMLVSTTNVDTANLDGIRSMDMPVNCAGSLHHLIVESCIARNLLDTSAYHWSGYINRHISKLPHDFPALVPGWSAFMKGEPLTPAMVDALVSTPACSYAEIERVFQLAVGGSLEERKAAATILCGASFIHGWNVQEHTAYYITRLLSPPVPMEDTDSHGHLISYAPTINILLVGIAPVDSVQIFSLHGLVPELAASLMTICEVFGSSSPDISGGVSTGEEISSHAVFSNAFALLLKLWRFNHPPLEYGFGDLPPVGSRLTLEYLLMVRNSHLAASENQPRNLSRRRPAIAANSSPSKPIFLDSFPKLKVWYRQHLACIASPLTGLVNGTTVHHTVDALLGTMFTKISRGNLSSKSSSSLVSDSSHPRPNLPAWDILEAVPFVAAAALTGCAHGRLSPRELCTGLKDLADYLPATLVTIVSYLSAEVTRGVWKSVFMNGTDWPSPAANLSNVEEKIKKILAATGVDVPSLAAGETSPAVLPLPLAAFVSLTITYKLDKASQRFLDLAGPALESLAAGCPWPCMPIVASLWTQKAKRWGDYLIFSASRTVFLHSQDTVVQLLRSCFNVTLGLHNSCSIRSNGGIGALLGHGFGSHFKGGISPIAPGVLYLRVYRSITDIMFLRDAVLSLLIQAVYDIATKAAPANQKPQTGLKNGHFSLAEALTKVKLAASLGASILSLTGGLQLLQPLLKETLPSWFISNHQSPGNTRGMLRTLTGYALASLVVQCGAFVWGIDDSSTSAASKRRPKIMESHLDFISNALNGKITLGCDDSIWHAYYSGLLSLMLKLAPSWIPELNRETLTSLSQGLRRCKEEELALALLRVGGIATLGSAAQLIVETTDF